MTAELALYSLALLCLITGITLIVRNRRRRTTRRQMGWWHEKPEVLRGYMFDDAKAREGDRRDF